ncbi:hypothetical protein E4U13_007789 [Claviceps humidiphila]|uniref:Uncharacterized protein n=1 Tax=Claviceps humidiphila TaxID=1294629 RepID=A0A9P7PT14_9HYPO|nr:hypothetical protein E4U13_007789 [Claviceps humidiphila]
MERYETDDDDNLSDESASLYTSDELYLDDASDNEKEISSEGEESFLPRTRRRIIRTYYTLPLWPPPTSALRKRSAYSGDMLHGLRAAAVWIDELDGRYFPQFHLDMGSLVGLPLRSVILEGSSSANGDNGLDLALCESITRLEKWMTKYGIEGD